MTKPILSNDTLAHDTAPQYQHCFQNVNKQLKRNHPGTTQTDRQRDKVIRIKPSSSSQPQPQFVVVVVFLRRGIKKKRGGGIRTHKTEHKPNNQKHKSRRQQQQFTHRTRSVLTRLYLTFVLVIFNFFSESIWGAPG